MVTIVEYPTSGQYPATGITCATTGEYCRTFEVYRNLEATTPYLQGVGCVSANEELTFFRETTTLAAITSSSITSYKITTGLTTSRAITTVRQASSTQTTSTQPTSTHATSTQPTLTQPLSTQSTSTHAASTQPTLTQPTLTQPMSTQPMSTQPTSTPTSTQATAMAIRGAGGGSGLSTSDKIGLIGGVAAVISVVIGFLAWRLPRRRRL
ncbi:hypothetical protein F4860DRAFT_459332 [Xylaria cubensis]|nr:hypothetical protein F4860DRAFT_459332 [Xylaria cubensis]